MARVFVAVGSNIDPLDNIPMSLKLIRQCAECRAISCFYETEPIGCPGEPKFVNGAFLIGTNLSARELKFDVLREIEHSLGRVRTADKHSSRTMDLDILLYDDVIIREDDLVIPDPNIRLQPFVALPVYEIDPEVRIPGSAETIAEIVRAMDFGTMKRLDEFTSRLRTELDNESRKS